MFINSFFFFFYCLALVTGKRPLQRKLSVVALTQTAGVDSLSALLCGTTSLSHVLFSPFKNPTPRNVCFIVYFEPSCTSCNATSCFISDAPLHCLVWVSGIKTYVPYLDILYFAMFGFFRSEIYTAIVSFFLFVDFIILSKIGLVLWSQKVFISHTVKNDMILCAVHCYCPGKQHNDELLSRCPLSAFL